MFSYLPLVSLIHKIALISKREKENLAGSGIARSTETLNLKLRGVNQTFWQIEDKCGTHIVNDSQMAFCTSLVENLNISVRLQKHNVKIKVDRLRELLRDLPKWFDAGKVSL